MKRTHIGRRVALGGVVSALIVLGACTQQPSTPPQPDNGRYVSASTGSDTGDCSKSASPCETINYAVSQAVADETVHVAAGTYPEMVTVDKPLVFEGPNATNAAGVNPVIRSAEAIVKGFRSPGSPHPTNDYQFDVTVSGFTIDPQGDSALLTPDTFHLVSLFGGNDVVVSNNIFNGGTYEPTCDFVCTDMADAAIMIQSGNYEVTNNTIRNFRRPVDVTQFEADKPLTSAVLSGNHFEGYTSRAIWVQEATWRNGGPFPGAVSITGNLFDGTGWEPDSGPAAIVMSSGGNTVNNNEFINNSIGVFLQECAGDNANPNGVANTFNGNTFTANSVGLYYYVISATTCGSHPIAANIANNRFEGEYTAPGGGTPARPQIGVYWGGDVGTNGADAPNSLDARCNYWDAASGPVVRGDANPDNANTMSLNVDATPWRISESGACTGS